MTDRDPFTDRADLEDALRRHFRDEVARTDFRPISADEIRTAARLSTPARRPRWLLAVAAAVVLVVAVVPIVAEQLNRRPVLAVPATVSPTSTPAAPGDRPSWTPRLPAPVDATRYAQVAIDDAVYLLAGVSRQGACSLNAYRYRPGPDLWTQLADGPERPRATCDSTRAFVSGSRIYLTVDADESAPPADRMEFYSYDTDDDEWATPQRPAPQGGTTCTPVGLPSGIFCLDDVAAPTAAPATFQYFDFATRAWTPGEAQLAGGQTRQSVSAHSVRVKGLDQVVLDARLPGGGIALALWDPVAKRLGEQTSHGGTVVELGTAQVTSAGSVFFAPPADPLAVGINGNDPRATTALLVDLASKRWASVEVPHPKSPLTTATPSSAEWALPFYGSSAAGYVLVNGYLYEPGAGRWLAVPRLPDAETAPSASHAWVGGALLCRTSSPLNCWGLSAGPLARLAGQIDPTAISAGNAQVR